MDLVGPIVSFDANNDGRDDVLAFTNETGDLELSVWRSDIDENGNTQLSQTTALNLATAAGVELVRCGADNFALTAASGQRTLWRIGARNGAAEAQAQAPVSGDLMACGTLSDGNVGVVVSDLSGAWTLHDRALNEVSSGTLGNINDVGLSRGAVFGCTGSGCSVAVLDIDGDGDEELFRYEAEVMTVEGWGDQQELPVGGGLRVVDADSDGIDELLVSDLERGRASLYRGARGGVTPPLHLWRGDPLLAEATLADFDGDGTVELLMPNDEGGLAQSPIASAP